MRKEQLPAADRFNRVTLEEDNSQLDEVVVVGYGQQKKASVVGAITQTTGEVLERAAGIGSVGAALTGNLPGVATIASSGQPGEEDPRIYIRGAAAWNQDAQPLILVDGVKREIKDFVWKLEDNTETLIDETGTKNFFVKEGAGTDPYQYDAENPEGIRNLVNGSNVPVIVYNVAGQRVNNNYKGIVVKNGSKYVVK